MVSDVELRRQKNIRDLNQSLRSRLNVSQGEINEAQRLVNRKLEGRRRQGGSTPGVERAFRSIINRPENLRRLSFSRPQQRRGIRVVAKPKPLVKRGGIKVIGKQKPKVQPKPKKFIGPTRPFTPKPKKTSVKQISPTSLSPVKRLVISRIKPRILPQIPKKIRDVVSLGLTKEIRERATISKEVGSFNKEVALFEKRFIGRELNEKEFALATKRGKELDEKLKGINKKEKAIKKSIPTKSLEGIKSSQKDLRKERTKEVKRLGVKAVFGSKKLQKIDQRLQALTITESAISLGVAVVTLPETTKNVISNPSQLKKVPESLKQSTKEFGKVALISPNEAIAKIGVEVFLLKGTGKTFKVVGKLSAKNVARVTGKLRKVEQGSITVTKSKKGFTLSPKRSIKKLSLKKLFVEKKTARIVKRKPKPALKLEVIRPGLKKILEPAKKQAKLIGKRIPVVTSAQAQKLVGLIRRKRVIRKPLLVGEKRFFTKRTKRLLKKFDNGEIGKKEFIELNNRIFGETKKRFGSGINLLERSFFVDPKGRIRVSRLGIQKEASLFDIVRGNFTFKTQKPQIIFFKNIKVQAFPKTKIFRSIKKKLEKQKTLKQKAPKLTKAEANALLKFQTKVSGKFKPIGALTKEPELTLAPGEIVKRVKTLAKVEINGVLVPIVKATVVKGSKETRKLLSKAKKGKASSKDIRKLRKNLKKETGFKTSLSRGRKGFKPRARLPKRIPRRVPARKRPSPRGRPAPKRPTPRPSPRPPARGRSRPSPRGRPAPRPSPRPGPRPSPRPPARPTAIPSLRLTKKKRLKGKPVRRQAFDVFARPLKRRKGQKRPKLIKVNKVPLSKKDAKDLRNLITDTSLARTGKIRPTRGKPTRSRLKVPKGFAKRTSKKFRRFKTVKGRKVPLPRGKVIERRRNILDTRQEKKQIGLRRRIKQINKPQKRKTIKRRRSPVNRGIFG